MRAKLRHLSWKRNFVLALFEEDTFFLRLRSGENERKGSRMESEKGISEKGEVSRKTMYKAPSSRARVQCFHVFCVHLFTFRGVNG